MLRTLQKPTVAEVSLFLPGESPEFLRLQLPVCCPELPSHVTLADLTLTNRPRISETKTKTKKAKLLETIKKKLSAVQNHVHVYSNEQS